MEPRSLQHLRERNRLIDKSLCFVNAVARGSRRVEIYACALSSTTKPIEFARMRIARPVFYS